LNPQDLIKVIRTRWLTVVSTAGITLFGAVAYTLIQTPIYEASTRLFVSTSLGISANDMYQGNRLSQERVLSYTLLIMGTTLAERAIDRLNLDMDAETLKENITAKAKPNTVLIELSVLDKSPVQARDIANALSDEFVSMVGELETPNPGARPDARVVIEQRAKIPSEPVAPRPVLNIALGAFIGGLLGVGLALLRETLDNTVKNRDTLEAISGTGLVGVLPLDKTRRLKPALSFDSDNSPSAEAYRKLRTNLQFLSVDNPPRLILVTSSTPNEGKSTSAINIALALAEADNNVLLIDGDMRRPSLHKYLSLVGSVGFSTVLSGGASLDDVLQKTQFPRLTVLTAGSIPPNPSELLGSLAAKKILGELRDRFDYAIIDSSPLLAVTDGAILAAEVDGTILLVRAGKTKRDQLAHSVKMLTDVGATILGAVLSFVSPSGSSGYGYGYGYGYYSYSYGSTGAEGGDDHSRAKTHSETSDGSIQGDKSASHDDRSS